MYSNRNLQVDESIQVIESGLVKPAMYRIVHDEDDILYLVEICKKPRKLHRVDRHDLMKEFNENDITRFKYSIPSYLLLPEDEISDFSLKEMNKRYEIMGPVLENINDIVKGNSAGQKAIKESIEKSKNFDEGHPLNKKTIYEYTYRYLMFSKIKTALLPARSLQGGKGKKRSHKNDSKPIGRPRMTNKEISTIKIKENEKAIIIKSYKRYYKKVHEPTGECCNDIRSLLDAIWFDHYIDEINEKGDVIYRKERISEVQLMYWLPQLIDDYEHLTRKVGKKNAKKDYRESYGIINDIAKGPGHTYVIDANNIDTYLGSAFEGEKKNSVGRAHQYNVVDVFSGMLTVTTIDFRSPCHARFLEALLGAFIKKSDFGKLWGVEINDDDWPCNLISYENLLDRGSDFLSTKKNIIHGRFGVMASSFCPAFRPEQKSLVESTNKQFTEQLFHRLPGKVIKALARGATNPAEYSCIEMPELIKLSVEVAYNINRRLLDRKYLSGEMMRDGVKPIPIEIWKWGLENCNSYGISSENFDKKLMILSLSEQVTIRANEKGVYTVGDNNKNKIFYDPTHPEIQKFVKLYRDHFNAKLIGDYYTGHRILGSVNFLYLISKVDSSIIKCRIHSRSQRLEYMHFDQVLNQLDNERTEDSKILEENAGQRARLTAARRGIAKKSLDNLTKGKKQGRIRAKDIKPEQDLEQAMLDKLKRRRIEEVVGDVYEDRDKMKSSVPAGSEFNSKDDDDFDDFLQGV